jgi:hypothetical protein
VTTKNPQGGVITINGVQYPIVSLNVEVISTYAEKQVFGDWTKDSDPGLSNQAWTDFSQGMGKDRMEQGDEKRSSFSTGTTRRPRHVTLPPLATQTETFASGRTGDILLNELDGLIVTSVGNSVQSYSGATWTERHIAAAAPTDALNLMMNKAGTFTEFLVYCYSSGYAYADAIGTWATSTKNTVKTAFWSDRLWGIDATGQLWFSFTVGSAEINDAQLPLASNDAVTGLFVGPDADRKEVLYATTKKTLWRHDYNNRQFVKTPVIIPMNLAASGITKQGLTWRGDPCIAANTGFIRYLPSRAEEAQQPILLAHDDGLPNTKEGRVFCMADSTPDLLLGTSVVNSTDSAAIFQWNDFNGFQVLWEATATNKGVESLHTSDAITNYRCWFGYDDRVWWIRLHDSVANPRQVQGWTYSDRDITDANSIIHVTPWFTADQEDVTKVILRLLVESDGCTANEAIRVEYALNYDNTTWTQFTDTHTSDTIFDATDDRIEGDGITTFLFPDKTSPVGLGFRAIRFRATLRRGSTATLTPDLVSITLQFLKVLPDKTGIDVVISVNDDKGGRSPEALRAAIQAAVSSDTLVEVTWRATGGDPDNFYMDVRLANGKELSGFDERGQIALRCEEK